MKFLPPSTPGRPPGPGPAFEPPYDSPPEESLAWLLHKFLDPRCRLVKQFPAPTHLARFRIDLAVITPGDFRLGIEIDGRGFHHAIRDWWRDVLILGEYRVDAILRFSAKDVYYREFDVLQVTRIIYPQVFDDNKVQALDRLARPGIASQIDAQRPLDDDGLIYLEFDEIDAEQYYLMECHHRARPRLGVPSWMPAYRFACEHRELGLEALDAVFGAVERGRHPPPDRK